LITESDRVAKNVGIRTALSRRRWTGKGGRGRFLYIFAVKAYNAAIKLAQDAGDNATKEILDSILKDEDSHVDEIETQQDQIKQMGAATIDTKLIIYFGCNGSEGKPGKV